MYWNDDQSGRMNFTLVSQAYEVGRPLYPVAVYESAFRLFDAKPRTLEIGSGSGQATGELAARSKHLDCVEPGQEFAAHLKRKFGDLDHVEFFNKDFEDFSATGGYDLVFSGSALHWVPKEIALAKIEQLLKPGGWMVTVWNQLTLAPQIYQILEDEVRPKFPEFQLPVYEPDVHKERFSEGLREVGESWGFESCQMQNIKLPRVVDIPTFVAMLESYTDVTDRDREEVKEVFIQVANALSEAKYESIEVLDCFPMAMAQRS